MYNSDILTSSVSVSIHILSAVVLPIMYDLKIVAHIFVGTDQNGQD